MRFLISCVLVLAAGWGGNWYWGFDRHLEATKTWLGEAITYQSIEQGGFPNRYDVTLSNVALPQWHASAEFIQILQVVYNSAHRIIVFPNTVVIGGQTITTSKLQSSAVIDDTGMARITIEAFDLSTNSGFHAKHAQLSFIPNGNSYTVYASVTDSGIDQTILDPDIRITLDWPLDQPLDLDSLLKLLSTLPTTVANGRLETSGGATYDLSLQINPFDVRTSVPAIDPIAQVLKILDSDPIN